MKRLARIIAFAFALAVIFSLYRVYVSSWNLSSFLFVSSTNLSSLPSFIVKRALQAKYWRISFLLYNGFSQQLYFFVLLSIAVRIHRRCCRRCSFARSFCGSRRPTVAASHLLNKSERMRMLNRRWSSRKKTSGRKDFD